MHQTPHTWSLAYCKRYLCKVKPVSVPYYTGTSNPIRTNEDQSTLPLTYTGNSALLRPPAKISSPRWIYGPITGTLPANCPMVIRKSPKRMNSPYVSIRKPVNGQRIRMRMIPAAKAAVPFSFWGREKNTSVFWKPIIRVRPIRKRICMDLWVGYQGGGAVGGLAYVSHSKSR